LGLFIFGCFIGDISFYEGVRDYSIWDIPFGRSRSRSFKLGVADKGVGRYFCGSGLIFDVSFIPETKWTSTNQPK